VLAAGPQAHGSEAFCAITESGYCNKAGIFVARWPNLCRTDQVISQLHRKVPVVRGDGAVRAVHSPVGAQGSTATEIDLFFLLVGMQIWQTH